MAAVGVTGSDFGGGGWGGGVFFLALGPGVARPGVALWEGTAGGAAGGEAPGVELKVPGF